MKKSLTFILAAALLVSCKQEENEAKTPANSRITISPIITRATEVNFEKMCIRDSPYTTYPYMHNVSLYAEESLSFPVGNTMLRLISPKCRGPYRLLMTRAVIFSQTRLPALLQSLRYLSPYSPVLTAGS